MATKIGPVARQTLLCVIAALGCARSYRPSPADNAQAARLGQDAGRSEADHDPPEAGDDADRADVQGASDELTCTDDADCDVDKVCKIGLCTGIDHPCTMNAECNTGEVCRSGNCEDPN